MTDPGGYLLDTHIWIWFEEAAADRLARAVVRRLRRAGQRGDLRVSPLSVWEVAMLESRGRLTLSAECRAWVTRALQAPGLYLAALTPEVAVDAATLPGDPHRDPIDRMLIATARHIGAVLVTCDRRILDYGALGHVRALDATPTRARQGGSPARLMPAAASPSRNQAASPGLSDIAGEFRRSGYR